MADPIRPLAVGDDCWVRARIVADGAVVGYPGGKMVRVETIWGGASYQTVRPSDIVADPAAAR
jgi:hypothetical protein